jgi:hypothetical protein
MQDSLYPREGLPWWKRSTCLDPSDIVLEFCARDKMFFQLVWARNYQHLASKFIVLNAKMSTFLVQNSLILMELTSVSVSRTFLWRLIKSWVQQVLRNSSPKYTASRFSACEAHSLSSDSTPKGSHLTKKRSDKYWKRRDRVVESAVCQLVQ